MFFTTLGIKSMHVIEAPRALRHGCQKNPLKIFKFSNTGMQSVAI